MKFKVLFIFSLLIFINTRCNARTLIDAEDDLVYALNKKRVILVSSSLALYFGASFYYVQNSWWSDISNDFHFDPGNDLVYALNVDKAAHFFGGVYASDLFSSSYRWAGIEKKRSLWYGAIFGTGIQLAIELKDAYAPYWGFSKWDFGIGSVGAFWPVLQNYYKPLQAFNFKFSYFKRSNIYWDLESQRGRNPSKFSWYDDYPNQTYWMTLDTDKLFRNNKFPKWLDFAFGFGLDDTQYLENGGTKMGGEQEFYIAMDYDINQILKDWDTSFARKIKFVLKYYKLPAPTLQISPNLKFHLFFM
tara:strand:- start:68 stop:976 length:909 start_codon:yes stop_codon:yes gene_type:complete